jgi:hypothetical protein
MEFLVVFSFCVSFPFFFFFIRCRKTSCMARTGGGEEGGTQPGPEREGGLDHGWMDGWMGGTNITADECHVCIYGR